MLLFVIHMFKPLLVPGGCFLCNTCPGDSPKPKGVDCFGNSNSESSAACVETTAYTLLALLAAKDSSYTVCLAQWLVTVRNRDGGYWSSQVHVHMVLLIVMAVNDWSLCYSKDTVIALQALAQFNDITFTPDIRKTLRFYVPGLAQPITRMITKSNRFDHFEIEVGQQTFDKGCMYNEM